MRGQARTTPSVTSAMGRRRARAIRWLRPQGRRPGLRCPGDWRLHTVAYVDSRRLAVTFGTVAEEWSDAKRPKLKPSTAGGYRSILGMTVLVRWRDVVLADITHTEVQQCVTWMTTSQDARQPRTADEKRKQRRRLPRVPWPRGPGAPASVLDQRPSRRRWDAAARGLPRPSLHARNPSTSDQEPSPAPPNRLRTAIRSHTIGDAAAPAGTNLPEVTRGDYCLGSGASERMMPAATSSDQTASGR